MKIQIQPKKIALWSYLALSAAFILYTIGVDFRDGLLRKAYEAGKTDTINALMENATNGKCEAVNVFSGEKKVDLLDVSCLRKADSAQMPIPSEPVLPIPGIQN